MRRSPAVVFVALLTPVAFLAGCSSTGDSESSNDASTTAAPTTAAPTTESSSPRDIEPGALARILPMADEIGADYTEVAPQSDEEVATDDNSADDNLIQACEALEDLDYFGSNDGDDDQVSASFEAEDQREIEVRLDPSPTRLAADTVDDLVAAFNKCGEVTIDDENTDSTITFQLAAERSDQFGDFGLELTLDASFELLGAPLELSFHGQAFVSEGIGVFISAISGFETDETQQTTLVPADVDLLPAIAALMDERTASL